jgi:pSer/pThr/pTyr-binding forkhead associated (FHA) protein
MTGQVYRGFLRQLSTGNVAGLLLPPYALSDEQEMVIGRDPSCQIILEPHQYTIVSRRHAVIRPLHSLRNGLADWEICDLSSANGTYINGQYLKVVINYNQAIALS